MSQQINRTRPYDYDPVTSLCDAIELSFTRVTVTSSHTAPERPTSSRIGSRGVSVQLCYSFRGTPRQFNPPIKKHTFPSWLRDPPTTLYVPEGAHAGPIFVSNNKVDRFAGRGDLVREDVALLREGNGSRMSRYSSSSSS
ncbi:hypothetical protein GW17_00049724 [Ensete ventricosum]|nr:hypothetical protein GW17_00049724 [Ensete ventricosum]